MRLSELRRKGPATQLGDSSRLPATLAPAARAGPFRFRDSRDGQRSASALLPPGRFPKQAPCQAPRPQDEGGETGKNPSLNFLFGFASPIVSKDKLCLEEGECKMLQFQAVFSIVQPILKAKEICFLTREHFDRKKQTLISVLWFAQEMQQKNAS